MGGMGIDFIGLVSRRSTNALTKKTCSHHVQRADGSVFVLVGAQDHTKRTTYVHSWLVDCIIAQLLCDFTPSHPCLGTQAQTANLFAQGVLILERNCHISMHPTQIYLRCVCGTVRPQSSIMQTKHVTNLMERKIESKRDMSFGI